MFCETTPKNITAMRTNWLLKHSPPPDLITRCCIHIFSPYVQYRHNPTAIWALIPCTHTHTPLLYKLKGSRWKEVDVEASDLLHNIRFRRWVRSLYPVAVAAVKGARVLLCKYLFECFLNRVMCAVRVYLSSVPTEQRG